jgi:hypothetical protein
VIKKTDIQIVLIDDKCFILEVRIRFLLIFWYWTPLKSNRTRKVIVFPSLEKAINFANKIGYY